MRTSKFQFHVAGFKGKKGYKRNAYHVSDFVFTSYDSALVAGKAFAENHKGTFNRPQVIVHRESTVYAPKFDAYKVAQRRVAAMVRRIDELHLGVVA